MIVSGQVVAKGNGNGANLGFEAQLFLAADKLRKNLEPSDYKHVALGLIFLRHISNAFEAKRVTLAPVCSARGPSTVIRLRPFVEADDGSLEVMRLGTAAVLTALGVSARRVNATSRPGPSWSGGWRA